MYTIRDVATHANEEDTAFFVMQVTSLNPLIIYIDPFQRRLSLIESDA